MVNSYAQCWRKICGHLNLPYIIHYLERQNPDTPVSSIPIPISESNQYLPGACLPLRLQASHRDLLAMATFLIHQQLV